RLPQSTLFPYTTLFRSTPCNLGLTPFRWLWHRFGDGQGVARKRLRSRSKLARPNMARLSALSRVSCPSVCPCEYGDTNAASTARSEEHTSELQSRGHLV